MSTANHFKIKIRARGAEGGGTPQYQITVGVRDGAVVIGTQLLNLTESWANYTTNSLGDGSYTTADLVDLRVTVLKIDNEAEIGLVSEIEVEIYDSSNELLDTVKPNGDFSATWDCTEANHYSAVNHGISTPDDAKYIHHTEAATEILDTVNPSWVDLSMKINISDSWKNASEVKINIGDSWKTVTEMKINIGDAWKDIF